MKSTGTTWLEMDIQVAPSVLSCVSMHEVLDFFCYDHLYQLICCEKAIELGVKHTAPGTDLYTLSDQARNADRK